MGANQSSPGRSRAFSTTGNDLTEALAAEPLSSPPRSLSIGSVTTSSAGASVAEGGPTGSADRHGNAESPRHTGRGSGMSRSRSLTFALAHRWPGIKCPVCSKSVSSTDMEEHLMMCLTKPRLQYNEDVLEREAGECAICLDELQQGDTIARLPCLCLYHKGCIDKWFEVSRSCPEHPND
uniref:E3 ubiquitin-protein ligase ZNRF1 n=1 Tax=Eptatretus burgeri TaxID=7764 RepID=A0A8C4Q826_EPTBU